MPRHPVLAASSLLSTCLFSVFLTGCTLANTAAPRPVAGLALSGTVYGGQQALVNAKVYLLAVNPTGYAGPGIAASTSNASLSLLTSALTGHAVDTIGSYGLTSGATGAFALAGDYDCTKGYAQGATTGSGATTLTGSEQVYLYVLGGSGSESSLTNANSGLLVALGPCNAPYSTSLAVNELTTAAAAYAFAGYATDATHIGSSGSALALTGLINAGLNSANLVSIATGLPVASDNATTRPVATLYTIADILAACVNSNGSASSGCTSLFAHTKSTGDTGTTATDTATAAINLAHNPWPSAAGMTALYGVIPGTGAPYTGGLSAQPNDFTVGLTYTGGGLSYTYGSAIDGSGDAWTAGHTAKSLSKFSSTGAAISPSAGYTGSGFSIAIDGSGDVWTTNFTGGSISKFSSTGAGISPAQGYTKGGLNGPCAIAIDGSGDAWIANRPGNSVSKFSSAGTAISTNAGYTGGGISSPYGIAIDSSGNAWTANQGNNSVSEFSSSGTAVSTSAGYTGGGLSRPEGIAIDGSGNAWTANYAGNSLSKFSSAGAAISTSAGYTGGGLNNPYGIAIDGSGSVWTANYTGSNVSRFSSTGTAISPSTGYNGGMGNPYGVAIDGSGDVWTAGYSSIGLTELIGAATPVVTPVAANLMTPYSAPASKP